MIVQRFNLNLIPNQSPVIVHVNQYDTGTGRLVATLYEGNEPYSPNGTAVIQGTKPDGHGFQYTATLDGNVVTADLTEQMAPVAGDVRTQIVVTESSGVTGTFAFIIRVQPSALPSDTDMSESDYQYIEEAIREAQEAVQTAQEATETAQEAVERAEAAITETQENAEDSEAWAQGTRGGIPVEPTDPTYEHNAEYWAQYAERYAQGGLHYKASIPFANIPTTGMREGDMYDITDDFTTDSRFEEGAGIEVKGGTNIAWNSDNKWDILALPYIPKTTFNGRSGSILPMAGDYDSEKILLASVLHIGGETQNNVQEALEALSNDGVKSFNGRSGSILPMAGDYDSEKILLASVLHIGGETQDNVQEALEALSNDGVKSFNGRSGSVLPMAGDYSAEQVNYDSNQTVKQKIDALVTKEASDIAGQQSLVKDTVGWTGKNLIKNKATTQTINGVTFTVNADKSVTVNGTATAQANFYPTNLFDIHLSVGKYIVSGNPNGASKLSTYWMYLRNSDSSKSWDIEDDAEITVTVEDDYKILIAIANGYTANNLTFYPMLRKADITDPTYEPYHESVETMYEEEIHGVNLLKNMAVSKTENDITFTVNSDGSVTVNGTASSTAYLYLLGTDAVIPNIFGGCKLTGCPSGGSGTTYGLVAQGFASTVTSNPTSTDQDNGSGTIVSPSTVSPYIRFYIRVQGGTTVNNLVFKPMLRKADIEDSTYRPYNEQAIQNQLNAQGVLGAKNLLPQVEHANTTMTINGVTITSREDGSVLLNGTSTAAVPYHFIRLSSDANRKFIKQVAGKKVTISGTNVLNTNAKVQFWSATTNVIADTTGKGTTFTIPSDLATTGDYNFAIYIPSGATIDNIIVYPMLRLASDPDDTYQPYAMTNRELTEKVFEKRILTSSNNLNDIKETGVYGISTAPVNSPNNLDYSTLIVQANDANNLRQIIYSSGNDWGSIYVRSFRGNPANWTSWYKFTGTVVS